MPRSKRSCGRGSWRGPGRSKNGHHTHPVGHERFLSKSQSKSPSKSNGLSVSCLDQGRFGFRSRFRSESDVIGIPWDDCKRTSNIEQERRGSGSCPIVAPIAFHARRPFAVNKSYSPQNGRQWSTETGPRPCSRSQRLFHRGRIKRILIGISMRCPPIRAGLPLAQLHY